MNKKELASLLVKDNYTAWKELLYVKPECVEKLHKLLKGYTNNSLITVADIKYIRKGLEKNFALEQIKLYAKPSFCAEQKKEIYEGIESGLENHQVKVYALNYFNAAQMHEIRLAIEICPTDCAKVFARTDFSADQMEEIRLALVNENITFEEVKKYAKPEFDAEKLKIIYDGIEDLDEEEVDVYAKNIYSAEQMQIIREGFIRSYSKKDVEIYANPAFNIEQMKRIFSALKDCISSEKVKLFAKPQYGEKVMETIYNAIKFDDVDVNMLDMCINFVEDIENAYVVSVIYSLRSGMSFEDLVEKYKVPEENIIQLEKDIYDLL